MSTRITWAQLEAVCVSRGLLCKRMTFEGGESVSISNGYRTIMQSREDGEVPDVYTLAASAIVSAMWATFDDFHKAGAR